MSTSGTVFLLVMLGYNPASHEVQSTREMSWHASHSECLTVKQLEQDHGRRESFNHMYVCIPVVDYEMADLVAQNSGANYPRRHGSGNLTLGQ
jgi:hypothetical protein